MRYEVKHISMQQAKFTFMSKGGTKYRTRRSGKKINPTTITIHSTANPNSTALNERNWLINPSNKRVASWHIAVDDKMAVEAIPLYEQAYHAGNRVGNNTSIGIEICESGDRQQTLKNAVQLVATMLYDRKWEIDKLRRHFDWSGKNCPRILSYNNWAGWIAFKRHVKEELDKLKANDRKDDIVSKPIIKEPHSWAKEAWDWAQREGLFDGKRPREPITREEVAVVLKRLADANKI